jgi:hypothetical protein
VTFETRGLLRNVRVSVRVPSAETVVLISELSGPGAVVSAGLGLAVAVALVASPALFEQPMPTAASKSIVNKQIFFVTLYPS